MRNFASSKRLASSVAGLLLLWACNDEMPVAPAESLLEGGMAPEVNTNLVNIVSGVGNFVVDAAGNEVTDPDALLWYRNPFVPGDPLQPLLAPDDHQVTLGEYTAVTGRARAKCTENGTKLSVHLSGLFPKGVYTIWLALFNPPFDGTFAGLFAVGAAGPSDGSKNAFRASASGEGQVSLTMTAGELSIFGALNENCLFTDPSIAQWHIIGAYHTDGQTHGGDPGPRAEPFVFVFDN